jgi:hypothetical protein
MSNVDRRSELARTEGRNAFQLQIEREVTSWEGVTQRRGRFGTIEFRLGRFVIGAIPLAGLVDERTIIQRMRDAYERAQDALDRGAGVTV